jgi:hypothetical protein
MQQRSNIILKNYCTLDCTNEYRNNKTSSQILILFTDKTMPEKNIVD